MGLSYIWDRKYLILYWYVYILWLMFSMIKFKHRVFERKTSAYLSQLTSQRQCLWGAKICFKRQDTQNPKKATQSSKKVCTETLKQEKLWHIRGTDDKYILRVEEQDLEFTLACLSRRDKVDYRPVKKAKRETTLRTSCIRLGSWKLQPDAGLRWPSGKPLEGFKAGFISFVLYVVQGLG